MVNFFLRLYDMLHQRKALFTGLLLGLIMTLLVLMFSLSYNENIYDFLPLSGNEQKAINIYQDISGGQRIYAMFNRYHRHQHGWSWYRYQAVARGKGRWWSRHHRYRASREPSC